MVVQATDIEPDSGLVGPLNLTIANEHGDALLARSDGGQEFLLRAVRTVGALPLPALGGAIDRPVATAWRGPVRLRVHRRPTEPQWWPAADIPVTVDDVFDLFAPLLELIKRVHTAGYTVLRLAPWLLHRRDDRTLMLAHLDGLHPRTVALEQPVVVAGYSAPELRLTAGLPGPTADIYSVGAMLFAAIAGSPPPTSSATGEVGGRLRDLVVDLPPGIGPVVDRCLSPDPARRYRSIDELARALQLVQSELLARRTVRADLRVACAADTHIGIVKRLSNPTNQDAVWARRSGDGHSACLVVADGVSTAAYGSGDVASTIVRDNLAIWASRALSSAPPDVDAGSRGLLDALDGANAEIVDLVNREFGPFVGDPADVMGTTCVATWISHGQARVIATGDSRCYLVTATSCEQLTRDQNIGLAAMLEGVPVDAALGQRWVDALAHCVGLYVWEPDHQRLRATPVEPDRIHLVLAPGDRLVLCSDGLTDFIAPSDELVAAAIARIVRSEPIPDLAALALIDAANRGGGADNIGVAVAYIDEEPQDVVQWVEALSAGLDED